MAVSIQQTADCGGSIATAREAAGAEQFRARATAAGMSVALHLAVLFVVLTIVIVSTLLPRRLPAVPAQPLLILAIGFLLAQVGLGAIWWARTDGSILVKTALAALACAVLWLLIVRLLNSTRAGGPAAAAWGLSLTVQTLVTVALATAMEFWLDFRAAAARNRFNIGFLLFCTTLVAVLLSGGEAWAARTGWKIASVPAWEFFWQLQAVGLVSAALAVATLACVRLAQSPADRMLSLGGIVLLAAIAAPLAMRASFGDKAGATGVEMAWLFVAETLFLAAALGPAEWARNRRHSTVTA